MGTILGSRIFLRETKNWTTFGTLFLQLSGVHIMRNQELNERGAKATAAGIIFSKRKGGIRPCKAL